jgi:hypothetical protein
MTYHYSILALVVTIFVSGEARYGDGQACLGRKRMGLSEVDRTLAFRDIPVCLFNLPFRSDMVTVGSLPLLNSTMLQVKYASRQILSHCSPNTARDQRRLFENGHKSTVCEIGTTQG